MTETLRSHAMLREVRAALRRSQMPVSIPRLRSIAARAKDLNVVTEGEVLQAAWQLADAGLAEFEGRLVRNLAC